jgi:predicted GNAT family acetyltransferase
MTHEHGGDAACWAGLVEEFDGPDNLHVVDDSANGRLVLNVAGAECELDYRVDGRRYVVTHVGVPPYLRNRGLAARLVEAAVDHARRDGLAFVPLCSYAAKWLRDRPAVAATLATE